MPTSTEQTNNWSIEQINKIKLPLVNKFYRSVGARGKASADEDVWVVRNTQIIAAARLKKTQDSRLLVGVYVFKDYRGLGIAKQLISHVCSQPSGVIYTFAYTDLLDLYLSISFKVLQPEELPSELQNRFTAYIKQGRKITPLKFEPKDV